MLRIGPCLEAVVLTFLLLPVLGCEQTAQPRSASLLSPPAVQAPHPDLAGDLPDQARQIISEALADPNPQIRANAVEVVAATRDIRLMPKVQRLLADPVVPVRFAAVLAVGDLEYALARNDIIRLLEDPNPNIKVAASYAAFRLGSAEHYEVLCQSVGSSDQTVRANAALVLGKSGKPEGARFLYWTLRRSDSADKVVQQAAEAIAMLRDARIYPKLWTMLISKFADDRVMGIRAMGALGTAEAKNALVTMLDDAVPEVRLAAAEQLGKLGDSIGEPEILAVIEKGPGRDLDPTGRDRVKMLTALAIGEVGTPAVAKHLPPLLRDPSRVVRLAAAKAVLRSAGRRPGL